MEDWGRSFEECVQWDVGDGKKVLFWEDGWVGSEVQKSRFPWLFSLSSNKDAYLESFGCWVNGSWTWDLVWRRGLFDWELDQERQLFFFKRDSRKVSC